MSLQVVGRNHIPGGEKHVYAARLIFRSVHIGTPDPSIYRELSATELDEDNYSQLTGLHPSHLWFIPADGGERRELCKACAFAQSPAGDSVAIWEDGSDVIRVLRFNGIEVAQLSLSGDDPIVKDLAWYGGVSGMPCR